MRLFPARTLLLDRDPENGSLYVGGRKPYVVLISLRDQAIVDHTELRALGYRRIAYKSHFYPSTYYARPLPLWALLKTADAIRDAYWYVVWGLYQHGIFHLAAEEGTDFRWRDVRPGPDRSARLTQEDIAQEMTRIQAEAEERHFADPTNMLGAFRTMVADESLDKQTRELAHVAIEELEKPPVRAAIAKGLPLAPGPDGKPRLPVGEIRID